MQKETAEKTCTTDVVGKQTNKGRRKKREK